MTDHHKIKSLRVHGGFLQGVVLDFADGLNCIIGGRGTGKTTVLEVVRFVLDRMPDGKNEKKQLQKTEQLISSNLGHSLAEVDIETKARAAYTVSRMWGDSPQVTTARGTDVKFDISKNTVFGVDIYSQSQIERIASTPHFQLELIDKFAQQDLIEIQAKIDDTIAALKDNARQLHSVRRASSKLKEKLRDLPDVEERLKSFSPPPGIEPSPMEAAHAQNSVRLREAETLAQLETAHEQAIEHVVLAKRQVYATLTPMQVVSPNGTPNEAKIIEAVHDSQDALAKTDELLTQAIQTLTEAKNAVSNQMSELEGLHAEPTRAYRELIAKHQQEKLQGRERERIQQQLFGLKREQTKLASTEKERDELVHACQMLRTQLSDLRDRRHMYRVEIAEYLSRTLAPTIRVRVEQSGVSEAYYDLLTRAMKNSGIQYSSVVQKIVQQIPPAEFVDIVQNDDRDKLARDLDIETSRAAKVISHIQDSQEILDLDVVELPDRPVLELLDGEYKDSSALSTGQKCTVILPILLLESERPLIIDQPEDNLDNAFIFDTVVRILKESNGNRQLIFITHNPNIPVLGDAARVFCLHSTGKAAGVMKSGSVDDVAEEIMTILEGGHAAFDARSKRYGKPIPVMERGHRE